MGQNSSHIDSPANDQPLPDDLVAPLGGEACCGGELWLAPILDVVNAALGRAPLTSPCCQRRWRPRDLSLIKFVSQREWEAAPDDAPPPPYYIEHVALDETPPCADACATTIRTALLEMGVDAHVSHLPPLVETGYIPLNMRCPHGVLWFTEPTSEQRAAWARGGVE